MPDELGERIAKLEVYIHDLRDQAKARAGREWGVIMSVVALLLTVLARQMGWIQ